MTYAEFFRKATRNDPYPYQQALAEADPWPDLLQAPTGSGKTKAVILAWLWRRFFHETPEIRAATPRRLVYCLPMRALATQTQERVKKWLASLELEKAVNVALLMGGEDNNDGWRRYPEKLAIIIGTQDMLLSRALNRGYAQSPYQWPIDFGLLNNDCLWALDEVQLMQNGLATSAQLAAFRRAFQTFGPAQTLWLSATIRPEWLQTVDFAAPPPEKILRVSDAELREGALGKRNQAVKTLRQLTLAPKAGQPYNLAEAARAIKDKHQDGALTLAVVNTVPRAQEIFSELQKFKPAAELLLVHSRFRQAEREKLTATLTAELPAAGRIIIATQAVEAGVDIDARLLFTELAPWPSLVQRFGRCKRRGEREDAEVWWLDLPDSALQGRNNAALPYDADALKAARALLLEREGQSVGPSQLPKLTDALPQAAVLRRRDLLGLFDTAADLSGNYLDVSRYVRGADDADVAVFWREFKDEPPSDLAEPQRQELCSVRIGYIRDYIKPQRKAWRWDQLDEIWEPVGAREARPGQTLLLRAADGAYDPALGWSADSREPVPPVFEAAESKLPECNDSEHSNVGQKRWVTLQEHSADVRGQAEAMLREMNLPELAALQAAIVIAAHWHDAGKTHLAFQTMLISKLSDEETGNRKAQFWAKRGVNAPPEPNKRLRFRHEVGSAIAILSAPSIGLASWQRDLAAYLALAHHGKARLALRSLPSKGGRNPDPDFLLGYKLDGSDKLPAADLGEGAGFPETALDLSIARLGINGNGEPSWLERSLGLLERLGPFRLAFLEALVRMADWRASQQEQEKEATQ